MKMRTKVLLGGGAAAAFLLWWFRCRKRTGAALPADEGYYPLTNGASSATGEAPTGTGEAGSGYYPVGTPGVSDARAVTTSRTSEQLALEAPDEYAAANDAATAAASRATAAPTVATAALRTCPPNYSWQNGECVPIV